MPARQKAGIAIGRRAARFLLVSLDRSSCALLLDKEMERPVGSSPGEIVKALLQGIPRSLKGTPLSIALSGGDLACDDSWKAPEGLRPKDIETIGPVLLEARATGETLEQLAVDLDLTNGDLQAIGIRTDELSILRKAISTHEMSLTVITSLSAALACTFRTAEDVVLTWAGQRVEVKRTKQGLTWRSVPMDSAGVGESFPSSFGGLELGPGQTAALSAALADGDSLPNVLRGAPDAPRTFGHRFRLPLWILAEAAAIFLLSLGFFFRAEDRQLRAEVENAERVEAELWKRHFPERSPAPRELLRTSRDRLRDSGLEPGQRAIPSAFLFWMDLGKHLPEVEHLGFTLETLDLTPDGGRLSATVSTVPADPLAHAAFLEAKLNGSSRMTARGDFEAREKDIQVRFKMEHRSR